MHELTGFSTAPRVVKGFGDESVKEKPIEVETATVSKEQPLVEKAIVKEQPVLGDGKQPVIKLATDSVKTAEDVSVVQEETPKVSNSTIESMREKQLQDHESRFLSDAIEDDWENDFLKREMRRESAFSDKTQKLRGYLDEFDEHPIRSLSKVGKSIFAFAMGMAQRHGMKQMVKNGRLVKAGAMEFVQSGKTLMAYRYCGTDNVVEIPSEVGNLPVVVIHPDFFNADVMHGGLLHSYKARALKSAFMGDYAGDFSQYSVTGAANGIQEVRLPNTLQSIFAGTFDGCKELNEIVIPESVTVMPASAVSKSGVKQIFFNGEIPKDFKQSKFDGTVFVRRK